MNELIPLTGCAKWPWLKAKTKILMIKNRPLTARLKAPPTVETFAIASIPRDEKNVTIKTPTIPITPKVSTEDKPNKCHDEVVSFPKITDDNGIQKLEAV